MKRTLLTLCTVALFAAAMLLETGLPFVPTAFAQQFKTRPLYRFQSARGQYLYTTDPKLPPGMSDGPWESEGIVCHVPDAAPHGTKPIYLLSKSDDFGVRFLLTASPGEADSAAAAGWTKQGIHFYVANMKLPGTVPLHSLYKPVIPGKKKDTGILASIKEKISGPEFTTSNANVLQDAHFYTTSENEKTIAVQGGFAYENVIGYVWLSPQPPPAKGLADLVLKDVKAAPSSVSAVIFNQGQASTGGAKYNVTLVIYDDKHKVSNTLEQVAPGLSPGQGASIKFQVGGILSRSMHGKSYQLKIDTNNTVDESNENNNETAMLEGPAAIEAAAVPTPDLAITNKREDGQRTTYVLTIVNSAKYPAADFQVIDALPPDPCGEHPTKARMLLRISAERNGAVYFNRCVPLSSPQILRSFDVTIPSGLVAQTKISVVIEDRLLGAQQKSIPQLTGLFNLSLPTCKNFLGRQGEIMRESQTSFAACENLKKNGVPVKCGLAGKIAPK